jgi:hypothetical protein
MNIPTEISFYDENLGIEIRGSYVVEGKTISIIAANGAKSAGIVAVVTGERQTDFVCMLLRDLAWHAIEDWDLN